MEFGLKPVAFEMMPGWLEEDPGALFAMMRRCHDHIVQVKPYKTGSLGILAGELSAVFSDALDFLPENAAAARAFFEARFQPCLISRNDGASGFVTAFYEPEVDVASQRDEEYCHPFYSRPLDLVDLDDASRPAGLEPSFMFAMRREDGTIIAYADRRSIDEGHLAGRGLEIAWAKSRIDVFFAHVQGAARLRYRDGSLRRITYAAKSGHPFSAIGRLLVDRGEIPISEISMQSIRAWLAAHPEQVSDVLWHNKSYIFFREAPVEDQNLGPIAAAKVALTAGRSLAVDRLIHTFSTPFFIRAESLLHLSDGQPFSRLMMALDTGTAIVGPARGDIFTGSGDLAGELAGNVRNDADFYILLPRSTAARILA